MTADEVKNLLKIYYDLPQMTDEEFAVIRHCEAEKNKIALPSVNLTGLPGGKGLPGDTAWWPIKIGHTAAGFP